MSQNQTNPPAPSSAPIRQGILVLLLVIMLGALWYDYKVARPAVETAFQQISTLNEKINGAAGQKYMTEKDVQQELQRAPIRTFSENGYFVEVYGWRAGLPTKYHEYFAIYTDGQPHIFQTHSKNIFDTELVKTRPVNVVAEDPSLPNMTPGAGPPPAAAGDGEAKGEGKKRGKKSDKSGEATSDSAPPADSPKSDSPKADAPKEDAPKEDAPKEDAPKEDAPKEDAPKADAPKEDAPKADAPKADAPKADAPKADAPKADEPKSDAPKADAPKADDPPKADAPKDAPAKEGSSNG